MENREAIEYLNDVRNGIHIPAPGIELPLLNDKEKKAIDLAISALEKQEKKPAKAKFNSRYNRFVYFCPVCGEVTGHYDFCSECGQAIDYDNTEEEA